MSARPVPGARRRQELAKIHILKSELGLDRDSYENVLYAVQAGTTSAAALDEHGRRRLIEVLVERKAIKARGVAAYPNRPRNADVDTRRELKKIEALLTDAGLPWTYAIAILNRQTNGRKNRMEFADGAELLAIVAALEKAALKRLAKELDLELAKPTNRGMNPEAIAILGFSFPSTWALEKNTAAMSQVLRFLQGRLAASCKFPVELDAKPFNCCVFCFQRAMILSGRTGDGVPRVATASEEGPSRARDGNELGSSPASVTHSGLRP